MDPAQVVLWVGASPPPETRQRLTRAGLRLVIQPAPAGAEIAETAARLIVVTGTAGEGLAERIVGTLRAAPRGWVVAFVARTDDITVAIEAGAHDATVTPASSEALVRHLLAWREGAGASPSRAAALGPLVGRVRALEGRLLEMELERRRLRDLSDLDDVTGLANPRLLGLGLRQIVAHACRYGAPVSLLALGIDGFEEIERSPGRPAERVLRHVAEALRTSVRACDLAGSAGAGRFAVVLPSTELHAARQVADRVRARVSLVHLPPNRPVTASVGISTLTAAGWADGPTPGAQELLARAVRALESAMRRGGDRVVVGPSEDGDVTEVRRCPPTGGSS